MTSSVTALSDQREKLASIGGERRGERRYELELEIQWNLLHRRRVLDTGTGRTRDLSSHGVLFETGRALPLGSHVEASIAWPALLQGVAHLKLMAAGRGGRSETGITAIRVVQHEFHTTGAPQRRAAIPGSGVWQ